MRFEIAPEKTNLICSLVDCRKPLDREHCTFYAPWHSNPHDPVIVWYEGGPSTSERTDRDRAFHESCYDRWHDSRASHF